MLVKIIAFFRSDLDFSKDLFDGINLFVEIIALFIPFIDIIDIDFKWGDYLI